MKFIVLASVAIAAPAYGAYGQQAPVAIPTPTNTNCPEEMAAYSSSVAAYAAQTQAPVGAAYGVQTTDSPVIATPSAYGGYGAQTTDLPVVATTTPCEQDLPVVATTTAYDECEEDAPEVTTAPVYGTPAAVASYPTATADLPVAATTSAPYGANVISSAQTAGFSVLAAAAFLLVL
ncbi:hypothetical protein HK103_000787 [Boothiomyces macroporosus]|uniref:Uncharacterized protein n=1 Tax=Boothiomyces macroporosus TaxID=261099 RepID=A0AAD5UDZ7_9FUNG|nr:hypothetical protein HK103_001585 [Boothiomyces macroporosus]KAJ3253241.1 hypothetical protein HK103_000787 [Boothiomyces macroporosus]